MSQTPTSSTAASTATLLAANYWEERKRKWEEKVQEQKDKEREEEIKRLKELNEKRIADTKLIE